jgi:hypothetical protein
MGFYKDGKWQPSANEIAAGEYVDNSGNSISAEHEADTLRQLVYELRRKVSVLEADLVHEGAFRDAYFARAEAAESQLSAYREALERLRDCDWVITPHDRMDAVRDIARQALAGDAK